MKYLILAYLLTICLVASSGQQNTVNIRKPISDTIKCTIDYKADSIAKEAAIAIDSVYKRPRLIAGRIELLPTIMAPVEQYTWWYIISGKDSLYVGLKITYLK